MPDSTEPQSPFNGAEIEIPPCPEKKLVRFRVFKSPLGWIVSAELFSNSSIATTQVIDPEHEWKPEEWISRPFFSSAAGYVVKTPTGYLSCQIKRGFLKTDDGGRVPIFHVDLAHFEIPIEKEV